MSKVESGITLTAIMDGVTVNGYIKVLNTPLIQRYTEGSNKFVPDFEALSDAKKPVVATILRDSMSGEIMVPNTIAFKYNGIPLTFGEDGLCNTDGFEGIFKKVLNHPVPMGAGAEPVNMTVLQVVKNLVPISGYDTDTITVSGTIEVGGQSMDFTEISTPVIIQETEGNQFDVIIEDDNGGIIDKIKPSVTMKANVLRDSVIVNDLHGFLFKWYKVTGSGDVPLSSNSNTQVVTADDVDDTLLIRCDLMQGDAYIISGYHQIRDFSDTFYVRWDTTNESGTAVGSTLRKGNTVYVEPVAVSREDNSESRITECSYKTIDNGGKDFTLTGKGGPTFTVSGGNVKLPITYDDVKRAGYGLHIRMNATL